MPGQDNELDYVAIAVSAAPVKGLPTLGWVDSSAVLANTRAVPLLSLSGAVCLPAFFEDGLAPASRTMLQLSEITAVPSLAFVQRCSEACEGLKLFATPLDHSMDWEGKLVPALRRVPSPSPFAFGAGDLYEVNAFSIAGVGAVAAVPARPAVPASGRGGARVAAVPATPAIPGVAAVPGRLPADLVWWSLVKVGDCHDGSSTLPLKRMWHRGQMAPDRSSVNARDDLTSRVQAVSATLYRHLGALMNDTDATHPQRARAMRHLGDRLSTLPDELRSGSFNPDVLEAEVTDDLAYSMKASQQDSVTAGRVLHAKRAYPDAVDYLERLPSPSARRDTIIALTPCLPNAYASSSLFARLEPLDEFLREHSAFIIQCHNKAVPLEGSDGLTALLRREHAEWGKPVVAPGSSEASAGGDLAHASLSEAAWRRALIEDARFVQSAEEIMQLDLSTADGRREGVEIACLTGCAVYQRFFANPRSMIMRASVFTALHKCVPARREYIGRAQAAHPETGVIHKLQENWLPSEESINLIFCGRLSKWQMFRGGSGALALYNLRVSEPFQDCPEDQLYIVLSVIGSAS